VHRNSTVCLQYGKGESKAKTVMTIAVVSKLTQLIAVGIFNRK